LGVDHFEHKESEVVTIRQESYDNPEKVLKGKYDLVLFNPATVQFLDPALKMKVATWYLAVVESSKVLEVSSKGTGTVLASFDSGYNVVLFV
jgi:hypothetical protein